MQREEPGKQKPGSCRAQELSRSRAQGKERRKRNANRSTLLDGDDREMRKGEPLECLVVGSIPTAPTKGFCFQSVRSLPSRQLEQRC
jgi:hypothetical protein